MNVRELEGLNDSRDASRRERVHGAPTSRHARGRASLADDPCPSPTGPRHAILSLDLLSSRIRGRREPRARQRLQELGLGAAAAGRAAHARRVLGCRSRGVGRPSCGATPGREHSKVPRLPSRRLAQCHPSGARAILVARPSPTRLASTPDLASSSLSTPVGCGVPTPPSRPRSGHCLGQRGTTACATHSHTDEERFRNGWIHRTAQQRTDARPSPRACRY
jgi:hypothetical protein